MSQASPIFNRKVVSSLSPTPRGGMIRPYSSKFSLIHRSLDILCVVGILKLSCLIYGEPWTVGTIGMAAWLIGFFCFFAEANDLYRSWRIASLQREIERLWLAWIWGVFCLLLLSFFTTTVSVPSTRGIIFWFGLTPFVLTFSRVALRLLLRTVRSQGRNQRSAVIAGAGDLGTRIANIIGQSLWMGVQVVGFYDDVKPSGFRPPSNPSVKVEGNLEDLVQIARDGKIDLIYMALPQRAEKRMRAIIDKLADTTVSLYVVPDLFIFDLLHGRWFDLNGVPIVSVFETPFYGIDGWLKKAEDFVLGAFISGLTLIPMALIALGIKLTSPGPVFFRQRRYGLDCKEIEVWKFRTMNVCEDDSNVIQAKKFDPRVTRFGAFLRKTSLDELPQFLNVLQGHMSIVGPRPHAVVHNEHYRQLIQGYILRHKVKPGITGLAQIKGWRGETDTLEKMTRRVEFDLQYINSWSLLLDLKIVFTTFFQVFIKRNAY